MKKSTQLKYLELTLGAKANPTSLFNSIGTLCHLETFIIYFQNDVFFNANEQRGINGNRAFGVLDGNETGNTRSTSLKIPLLPRIDIFRFSRTRIPLQFTNGDNTTLRYMDVRNFQRIEDYFPSLKELLIETKENLDAEDAKILILSIATCVQLKYLKMTLKENSNIEMISKSIQRLRKLEKFELRLEYPSQANLKYVNQVDFWETAKVALPTNIKYFSFELQNIQAHFELPTVHFTTLSKMKCDKLFSLKGQFPSLEKLVIELKGKCVEKFVSPSFLSIAPCVRLKYLEISFKEHPSIFFIQSVINSIYMLDYLSHLRLNYISSRISQPELSYRSFAKQQNVSIDSSKLRPFKSLSWSIRFKVELFVLKNEKCEIPLSGYCAANVELSLSLSLS